MVTRQAAGRLSLRRRVADEREREIHHRAAEITESTEITELIWGLARNWAVAGRSAATSGKWVDR